MKVGFLLLGELLEHRRVHLSRGGGGRPLDLGAGNEEEGRVQSAVIERGSLNWSSSSLMMLVNLSETFCNESY